MHTYRARPDVSVLGDYLAVPGPSAILSTHLPPVTGDTATLFATLLDAPQADPFTGPDQAALEAMLREFQPA
jgi:hypothetical protein